MQKYLLIFLLIMGVNVYADTFTVTTPIDNAPTGSLRWAINQAANNNNGSNYDTITFNIPSGQANARAIQLLTELPALSSYLIIDGTTQLAGTPFGVSDAKIQIFPQNFNNCKRGFIINNAHHIEIYGLGFAGFINQDPTQFETYRDAIFMWNCHDIIIGAPSKGNGFTANYFAIRHEGIPARPTDPPPPGFGYNITIQNNYIGKNNTGRVLAREGCVIGVQLFSVYNVTIGGFGTQEANNFMIFLNSISLGLTTGNLSGQSNIVIAKNNFIKGTTTIPFPVAIPLSGITVSDNDVAGGNHRVHISGNDMLTVSTGIQLQNLKNRFLLVNNKVNCDRANNDVAFTNAITVNGCDSGLIGGADSANIIFNADFNGITENNCKYIEKSMNSIYCNAVGIVINAPAVPPAKIYDMYVDASGITHGKTNANASIEVFDTHNCMAEYYNGENFLRTFNADALGDFTIDIPTACFTKSYTATNTNKSTSKFYVLNDFVVDASAAIIQHATCGRNNGSITGIKIFSAVDFHWEDALGNTVGIDTNLINVGAGQYRLVATKQNIFCDGTTNFFTILTTQPVINAANVLLTHPVPQCNKLGSITGLVVTGVAPQFRVYTWRDGLGNVVGNTQNLINVAAGTYRLIVSVTYDPTCIATAGPFVLTDKLAPAFNYAALRITNTRCGANNGSISGISILNATGTQTYKWYDAAGVIIGTTINLNNIASGSYYLQYDDASPCPAMNTPVYTIVNNGLISIDETNKIIKPAGCTINNGAITSIVANGANYYEWFCVDNNTVVSNNLQLTNVASATYRLRIYDTNNGCIDSTSDITIPTTTISPLTVSSKVVVDETCSAANGAITNITFTAQPIGYTFKWVKNITDTFSTVLNISGLTQGNYQLIATDSNGCTQVAMQQDLINHPSPTINDANAIIANDECTQAIGSINGMTIANGENPFVYTWNKNFGIIPFSSSLNINKLNTGSYQLIVLDKNGCKDTSSILFVDNTSLIITPPQYDDAYAKRNGFSIIKNVNGIIGNYEIFDNPFATIPVITNTTGSFTTPKLTADKDYWVQRVVGTCKSVKVKVHVNVIDYSKVFVPNAFTPNNDGLNDELKIKVYGKILIDHFTVFNRWGQPVFITSNINEGWNGIFKGKPLDNGTYTWLIQGYDIDGELINKRGTVTIIR